jgi:D-serine deaminase-like pyridoxal phosphate-dependent protein
MWADELDTPVLTIDLDALEENLDRYQRYYDEHGIALRPHIKTHKSLAIAHMQVARGAIGLTCQKLGEAEVMVNGGLTVDMLIPYNIVGQAKLDRLARLAGRTRMTVAVDSSYTVEGLALMAAGEKVTVGVIVEVEAGMNRTGVQTPAEAVALAQQIDRAPGLELSGFMAYPTPPESRPIIQEVLAAFERSGLACPMVSGGGTRWAMQAHEIPELTEYRIGEYPTGGEGHLRAGRHTVEQCALRVIATVISAPTADRVILDAGSKTMSASTLQTPDGVSMGYIVEYPEARFYGASEEHGHVDVARCTTRPKIGERVQVLPVHPCPCVNEHDTMVALRGGRVEAVWPIAARGMIR